MFRLSASRSIKLLMAFAIFWMVIGELIAIHQERIFGVKFYGNHSPFTKPASKSDGTIGFWKAGKDSDKSYAFSFSEAVVLCENTYRSGLWFWSYLFSGPTAFLSPAISLTAPILRGPPSLVR